jgi:hypothetical protein
MNPPKEQHNIPTSQSQHTFQHNLNSTLHHKLLYHPIIAHHVLQEQTATPTGGLGTWPTPSTRLLRPIPGSTPPSTRGLFVRRSQPTLSGYRTDQSSNLPGETSQSPHDGWNACDRSRHGSGEAAREDGQEETGEAGKESRRGMCSCSCIYLHFKVHLPNKCPSISSSTAMLSHRPPRPRHRRKIQE